MYGKCPKCEKQVMVASLSGITAAAPMGPQWKSIAFLCPHCSTILGMQIDPITLKTDVINGVVAKMKGG